MVLLHGAGDNALDWRWVMPTLAATHQVYVPDLPGSPDSARPAADSSPAFFERFVAPSGARGVGWVAAGWGGPPGYRASDVCRQLARRPLSPPPSALRAGSRRRL